jgi:pimeloyl-ACP methyl ester carboxylesterase
LKHAIQIDIGEVVLNGCLSEERPPNAIFLHGFGGDYHSWDALFAECNGSGISTLKYDLRGFGGSRCDENQPFSHTEDLLAIFDKLEIGRSALVGLSMGGAVALNFALTYPERVTKLVLISPGMVGWEWSEDWKQRWRGITALARDGDRAGAKRLWWQHPLFDSARASEAGVSLQESINRYSGIQWIHDPQLSSLPDIERLHDLAVPTLLLSGGRDMADFQLIADVLAASSPNVQRIDFPEYGHMLPLEAPQLCANEIQRFLTK